ncbi:MAG: hypothetical protein R3E39_14260 [Anaerolineae bacterium]
MQISLDVVDLLQLQEIWSKRPIVTAFTRLEPRSPYIACRCDFNIDDLMPRLARLKRSPVWLAHRKQPSDPARIPMCELSDDMLVELYPEADSPAIQRHILFTSAYCRFVISSYRDEVFDTAAALHSLAQARRCQPADYLSRTNLPDEGGAEWIPADITDEIRGLDGRYNPEEPGAPATFVVSDDFWPLLTKAEPDDISAAVNMGCDDNETECRELMKGRLEKLIELAHDWYRSPSVVGLCYLVNDG